MMFYVTTLRNLKIDYYGFYTSLHVWALYELFFYALFQQHQMTRGHLELHQFVELFEKTSKQNIGYKFKTILSNKGVCLSSGFFLVKNFWTEQNSRYANSYDDINKRLYLVKAAQIYTISGMMPV